MSAREVIQAPRKGKNLRHICFRHLHALNEHLSLQLKMTSSSDLRTRLKAIWKHRANLIDLKKSKPLWFRMENRPRVPEDFLEIYAVRLIRESIEPHLSLHLKIKIVNELRGSKAYEIWKNTDNVIIQFKFTWLFAGVTLNGVHESEMRQEIRNVPAPSSGTKRDHDQRMIENHGFFPNSTDYKGRSCLLDPLRLSAARRKHSPSELSILRKW